MAEPIHPLTASIRRALAREANPVRAAGTQMYMKSAMPYRGVSSPVLKGIYRDLFAAHLLTSRAEWRAVALQLWRGASFREERYAAIGLVDAKAYAGYRTLGAIPMLQEMIVTGAWWDYVDALATHPLGDVLVAEPARTSAVMRRWAADADMWKRRASILCQIRRKKDTDLRLLYDCIEPNLADREFFIRKAIGWALRQYAWTDPREVARYVKANRARLSPLSAREALKNIARP